MNRTFPKDLAKRWQNPNGLIQVFVGPRQVGKTTTANSLANPASTIFMNADAPAPPAIAAIEEKWNLARKIADDERTLVLDEVQKIPGWSEVVKRLWDEDQRSKLKMRVALLGSSALLIEKGMSESLTGRFEANFFPHWTYGEVQKLTPVSINEYVTLGGYPKAYSFGEDTERARAYLEQSIIEPTLGRDILSLHAVDKPALLRQLFWYVSKLPAQIVSFDKILGALQDRGNSATIAHYAELLKMAFMVVPIFKYSQATHRTKRSLPKWIFPNPALVSLRDNKAAGRGFVIENLVGAHLLNITYSSPRFQLSYWREGNSEIDFVILDNFDPIFCIEVKSNQDRILPAASLLAKAGLTCPIRIVNESNLESFLRTTSIEEARNATII